MYKCIQCRLEEFWIDQKTENWISTQQWEDMIVVGEERMDNFQTLEQEINIPGTIRGLEQTGSARKTK